MINKVLKMSTGIELQFYAAKYARNHASVAFLSCKDLVSRSLSRQAAFDLVFTSGVLIHIAPDDLSIIMGEIYRCTSQIHMGI